MKKISILGSTGSIGENTLRIVRVHPKKFKVLALAAHTSSKKLYEQAIEFKPKVVCLFDESAGYAELSKKLKSHRIQVVSGEEGLAQVATVQGVDQVICAMVGAVGLSPLFDAVKAGIDVAVANKEPLVMAGQLLLNTAKRHGVSVLPIDSEHSALWQCLEGYPEDQVKRLVLTSSGGPFRNLKGSFKNITPKQALNHPKWKMGPKISIDSATLMNKGLEVIEAAHLFKVSVKKIDVLVHPEAIVHGMVEFVDGSFFAHMGVTDMRLPIQYAMSYPARLMNHLPRLDLAKLKNLSFEEPKMDRFPCLKLGYEAGYLGGTMPAVLNAANEVFVEKFLNHKISFPKIARNIEKVMTEHHLIKRPKLKDILDADLWARETAEAMGSR